MIALDTNVIVRIVTNDDPGQAEVAVAAIDGQRLWLAKTVLLETEWVLRYSYALDDSVIQRILLRLLGLENLEVEDRAGVLMALTLYREGMDFADALHLASCTEASTFLTFDRDLALRAAGLETAPSVELLESG